MAMVLEYGAVFFKGVMIEGVVGFGVIVDVVLRVFLLKFLEKLSVWQF